MQISLGIILTSWRMRPSAARQRRFTQGEVSLCSPSTQECIHTISTHDARAKSCYAPLRPKGKGEPSLCSASTQECILTISTRDARVKSRYAPLRPKGRPHNAHLQCKGKPLLHSASTQECILTISAHDPRLKSRYVRLRPKCKASQCSSLYHLDPHLCFWQDGGLLICLQR